MLEAGGPDDVADVEDLPVLVNGQPIRDTGCPPDEPRHAGGLQIVPPNPLERPAVERDRRSRLAAERRADRQDVMNERPEAAIDDPSHPAIDRERHLAGVAAREPGLVARASRAERDLAARIARTDDEDRPGLELRRAPILARVELGDVGSQLARELGDARLAEPAGGDDDLRRLESVVAGADHEPAVIGPIEAVDADAEPNRQARTASRSASR